MNAKAPDNPLPCAPILVDAETASKLLSVGVSLFYALDSKGAVPQPVHLNSKKLWSRLQLEIWAQNGCPSRDSAEWQAVLARIRTHPGETT